jgi:hypothetical protein
MRFNRTLALGLGALLLAFGCAPSNPGLIAQGVIALDTMCLAQTSNDLLAEGVLDIDTSQPATLRPAGLRYGVSIRIGNELINNSNRVYPLMADPDYITVDHMEVTLMDSSEQPLGLGGAANPYLVPAVGAVASTASMDPTLGVASATIIPDAYGTLLAGAPPSGSVVVVRIRVIGTTNGGAQMISGPVLFPIRLCVGCLFQCATDAMGHPINSPSCLVGQDAVTLHGCP